MIKKVDHIGIAVSDLDSSSRMYQALTGKQPSERETVPSQKVETTFFQVGELRLELLRGTSEDSPISRFIDKRGAGIHHICFEVDDLAAARAALAAAGLEFIQDIAGEGAGGSQVAFVHPRSTGGILIELVQQQDGP